MKQVAEQKIRRLQAVYGMFHALRRDRRGVGAVEFAIVAPLLVPWIAAIPMAVLASCLSPWPRKGAPSVD